MEIFVIVLLFALLAGREYTHFLERKDMLDRLMSKDLPEFKDNIKPEENKLEVEDDNITPIEQAKEDFLKEPNEDGEE